MDSNVITIPAPLSPDTEYVYDNASTEAGQQSSGFSLCRIIK